MYDAKAYWEQRLAASFDLEGVGCAGRGKRYNAAVYGAKAVAMERALRRAGVREGELSTEVDLGAGTGYWIEFFMRRGTRCCIGVDITDTAVERLRVRFDPGRTRFVRSDIGDPALPSLIGEPCEVLTAVDVLYHIVDEHLVSQGLANIAQMVAPGGYFMFTDCIYAPPGASKQAHVAWRPRSFWERLLHEHGFRIREVVPMYALLHAAVSGPSIVRRAVNLGHYRVTLRLADKGRIGGVYLAALSRVDRWLTRFGGTSLHLVVAQRG